MEPLVSGLTKISISTCQMYMSTITVFTDLKVSKRISFCFVKPFKTDQNSWTITSEGPSFANASQHDPCDTSYNAWAVSPSMEPTL